VVALIAPSISPLLVHASTHTSVKRFARVLLKRDPGRLVGGTTMVGTKPGAVLRGARGRINFMIALVNDERLVGGNGHDELGAFPRARGVRIDGGGGPDLINALGRDQRVVGGASNDLIRGGPGRDRIDGGAGNDAISGGGGNDAIFGGPGNDAIVDHSGTTTVITGPGQDVVDIADGRGKDRAVCEQGGGDQVIADPGDQLSRGVPSSIRRRTVRADRARCKLGHRRTARRGRRPEHDRNWRRLRRKPVFNAGQRVLRLQRPKQSCCQLLRVSLTQRVAGK
jgi:hypothetical protein